MSDDDGRVLTESYVRFERLLPGPIERVWDFLTRPERLGQWLLDGSLEPRTGGAVDLGNGHIRGVVTQWDPPCRLTYTWNVFGPGETVSPYPESYVTFELAAEGDDVRLVLAHRPIPAEFQRKTMMGWHTILDTLRALLAGEEPEPRDVMMERNKARYGA
jgi:uncharacterized protein YndB with AHSA1/START domain